MTAISVTTDDTEFAAYPSLDLAALHGLAGEIATTIEPNTEADIVAVLLITMTAFGNAVGLAPHARVGGATHPGRLNVVLVGQTSRGRKGQAFADAKGVFAAADPSWSSRVVNGLSSGEGLIAAVRDADGEDAGVSDKRRLVVEPEFARVLKVAQRDGNTLSAVLRELWDSGDARVMTRRDPLAATGAHVSIIGNITRSELQRTLTETDIANGLANRFLFACVSRSKLLPGGPVLDDEVTHYLGRKLRDRLEESRRFGRLQRTPDAEELWTSMYCRLAEEEPPGLVGAITARAEAQLLRLSVLYALLDGTNRIDTAHLEAAWALWRYCEASARYLFGDSTGDEIADKLLAALRRAGAEGMDGTTQRDLFGRHVQGNRLDSARKLLDEYQLALTRTEQTGGRPRVITIAAEFLP